MLSGAHLEVKLRLLPPAMILKKMKCGYTGMFLFDKCYPQLSLLLIYIIKEFQMWMENWQ